MVSLQPGVLPGLGGKRFGSRAGCPKPARGWVSVVGFGYSGRVDARPWNLYIPTLNRDNHAIGAGTLGGTGTGLVVLCDPLGL